MENTTINNNNRTEKDIYIPDQPEEPVELIQILKNKNMDVQESYIRLYEEKVLPECFEPEWTTIWNERKKDKLFLIMKEDLKEKILTNKKLKKKEKYNRNLVRQIEKDHPLFPYDLPYRDIFRQIIKTDEQTKKEKFGTVCVVKQSRAHWDAILFIYHLLFPEYFLCPAHVATYLLHFLTERKESAVDIEEIENYSPKIHEFLVRHSRGEHLEFGRNNWMIVDPAMCIYLMKRPQILISQNLQGIESDEYIKNINSKNYVIDAKTQEKRKLNLLDELYKMREVDNRHVLKIMLDIEDK